MTPPLPGAQGVHEELLACMVIFLYHQGEAVDHPLMPPTLSCVLQAGAPPTSRPSPPRALPTTRTRYPGHRGWQIHLHLLLVAIIHGILYIRHLSPP